MTSFWVILKKKILYLHTNIYEKGGRGGRKV